MPQHEVRFAITVQAPPERVFAYLADHHKFVGLFGGRCQRVREGQGDPNGLGSVRRVGPGPLSFDETIVGFEPPGRLQYQITRGGPLKNHLGTLDLRAVGETTQLDYVIRYDARIPGTGGFIGWLLKTAWNRNAPAQLARLR